MDFKMRTYGSVLESRDLATRLSFALLDDLKKNPDDHIRIDFGGVRVVSNFFADEFIGTMVREMGVEKFKASVTMFNLAEINRVWIAKAVDKHGGK
ncbi:MAG: DUF4325 domain-containing protein [Myxococcota bacterium]